MCAAPLLWTSADTLPVRDVTTLTSWLTVLLLCLGTAAADTVFTHRDDAGRVTFSDVPVHAGALRTAYRTDFGRPTATASCAGLDKSALDKRAARWQPKITAVARAHGLDPTLLLALVRVESCFDVRARSRAGAEGLTQLMPATAQELGVGNTFDADANLDGGARYLASMLRRYQDETLALAAYNAGPGNVDKYAGVPPFKETRDYLRRIAALR